jgi:hypothetical protein
LGFTPIDKVQKATPDSRQHQTKGNTNSLDKTKGNTRQKATPDSRQHQTKGNNQMALSSKG